MKKIMILLVSMLIMAPEARAETLVFVSYSMPENSLKAYSKSAKSSGSRLIMRGLHNGSFVQTKKKANQLGITFDIDPNLFEEFEVKVVPTFVKRGKDHFKKFEGHVTWQRAIEKLGGLV